MALWGNADATSNAVLSAAGGLGKAPNTANRDALYGNTTADAFITGMTIGLYNINDAEMAKAVTGLTGVSANNPGTGGNAIPGDVLTVANTSGAASQDATVNVTATELRSVTLNGAPAGTGFANGDTLSLTTGTGTAATFTVTTGGANTSIASLAIATRGVYTVNPTLNNVPLAIANSASGDLGGGITANVTTRIASLAVRSAGMYGTSPNTTANAPTGGGATGVTLVLTFAARENEAKRAGMTGWALRREGSGGRAGRITYELLVAGAQSSNGTSDDTKLPQ